MSEAPAVIAIAAHPDDIEFMMAGTLMLLGDAGWRLHYMNIANGSCGTAVDAPDVIVRKRTAEAMAACEYLGAEFHPPICNDLEVYHVYDQIAKVIAVIRRVKPRIVLAQSPQDYMEEHMNASRIAATAAFCRGMRNYVAQPPVAPVGGDVTVYHAMPYGLRGPLRERVHPGQYVNVSCVIEKKREMLACHRSQKEWLDQSQGLDSYLDTMTDFAKQVGDMSGVFAYAEGWRRRSHLGYSETDADPLGEALGADCVTNAAYERGLNA